VFSVLGLALIAGSLTLFTPASVTAQQTDEVGELTTETLLNDFIHFVLIRNDELAQSYANAILKRGLSPIEFVGLVEDSPRASQRFDEAIRKAMVIGSLEGVSAELNNLFNQGRLDRARDPNEIARNIGFLDDNPRARMLARERIAFAREYAVPQLLEVLIARPNPVLEGHVRKLLVDMGPDAVAPLCAALDGVDAVTQEQLLLILGQIRHEAGGIVVAAPSVARLAADAPTDTVRVGARRELNRWGVAASSDIEVSNLFLSLARAYAANARSLTRFPDEDFQLSWSYQPQSGLIATGIRTPVFDEMRTMELAETALSLNPDSDSALELWVAANISREIEQPAGWVNPLWGSERRNADYYAVAAGPRVMQNVLDRALTGFNTPVARRAIGALSESAGGAGLWRGLGERKPLLDALRYPDRRVQLEAALALGGANPGEAFPGSERVTPILASAVRNSSNRYGIVITRDTDRANELGEVLRNAGFEPLQSFDSLAGASSVIVNAPGVDMVIVDGSAETLLETIAEARTNSRLQASPIVGIVPFTAYNDMIPRFEREPSVELRREGITTESIAATVNELATRSLGAPVTESEALGYARATLRTLHDIAIGGSVAYNIADAAQPLIAALDETTGEIRLLVADVLSRIQQTRVQVALMDAAMNAQGPERVALLGKVADSARRFGDMLDERQIRWIVELAGSADSAEATAAAALIGSLNLPENRLVPLILSGQ
jgi:hypothetical protein